MMPLCPLLLPPGDQIHCIGTLTDFFTVSTVLGDVSFQYQPTYHDLGHFSMIYRDTTAPAGQVATLARGAEYYDFIRQYDLSDGVAILQLFVYAQKLVIVSGAAQAGVHPMGGALVAAPPLQLTSLINTVGLTAPPSVASVSTLSLTQAYLKHEFPMMKAQIDH
ncbi:hypothetical protein SCP_0903060 [Sparassis crispa]|uniref:Uncharacterized protein n=1 Tax=Sparassis crispa TaxID=139825 RepID=A0A401GW21_9APHY|nr:hypothetical protein SCP_0903060 [Sparassis crispa]GBE86427.1 hypothetical protein SCP_0903060 [Sparassis crispa]